MKHHFLFLFSQRMKMLNKATAVYGKFGLTLLIFLGAFLVLLLVFLPPSDGLRSVARARNLDSELLEGRVDESDGGVATDDLLPTGFDEESCLSRHQSLLYRLRRPLRAASPRLLSKLRSYEARHKRCRPHSESYNKTVDDLRSGRYSWSATSDCNYVVWMPYDGLGNRILSLASVFLYALLTNRVLLLGGGVDVQDLFCEPFPESSWLLPSDFPLTDEFESLHHRSHRCYGEMLRNKSHSTASLMPQPYVYLNLLVNINDQDKQFFCDEDQAYLHTIPWLVIRANAYFVPSFFLMPSFEEELDGLFPDKEIVFHLLGRYLLHPTNSVWGLVTRYYQAYLARADVTVGIQIRVFSASSSAPLKRVLDQILSCTTRENILPEISHEERCSVPSLKRKKTIAVLLTSLTSGYFEGVRDLYWENPTVTGEVITVFQPSNEGRQQTEKQNHNRKALAEIYLLSLTDNLVTSSSSTFGYSAQGLAGVRPWILEIPGKNNTTPNPPCQRGMSIEPCYHEAPKHNTCKTRSRVERGGVGSHVRACEDRRWDIKLFQN